MSEKYSTDELVEALGAHGIVDAIIEKEEILAIIARLQAGDKLCEAAKKAADAWWRITHEAAKIGESLIPANYDLFISDQVKAIAKYEGKEEQ